MWVQAPYEPYGSFIYLIAWPYSHSFWRSALKEGDGLVIGRWCSYKVRQAWPTMTEQERLAVEKHRTRSFGRNPIDEAPVAGDVDPLQPYISAWREGEPAS